MRSDVESLRATRPVRELHAPAGFRSIDRGQFLVRSGDANNHELWDYVSGEKQRVFPKSGGFVALSPRGDRLVTGNFEQTILIWDVASGTVVSRLKPARVIALAFSPNGQTLATSDWGSEVKMWDVSSGQMISSLTKSR
jgi:WD40 repeat protein